MALLTLISLSGCISNDFSKGTYNGDAIVIVEYESSTVNPLLLLDTITSDLAANAHPIVINGVNYGLINKGECKKLIIPSGIYSYQAHSNGYEGEWGFESNKINYLSVKSRDFGTTTTMLPLSSEANFKC